MKRNYISNEEYYETENAIYNDLPINTLRWVPKSFKKPATENFKRFLLEGEKYTFLKDPNRDHIAITNYGRVFNAKTTRQLKVKFTGQNVIAYFNGIYIRSSEVFEENGWEHDLLEMYIRYVEHDWVHSNRSPSLRKSYLERV